ncbi:GNAT family N-acetyltransferase [Flavobacteriales bacterium 34_180_T64]|nr:GNAT family N-acetyltransferase [Flavobacteriales bacterium 34_180_T64]
MNQSFEHFKITTLDTSDSETFYNLIANNRARLVDFFAGTVSKTNTLEDAKAYCLQIEENIKNKSYFPFIIKDLNNNYIGLVDVKNIDWKVSEAELGYFIDANFEGKGIITKAVGYVVEYLTKTYQFKKLLCRAGSENLGSIQVALNNGFNLQGIVKNDYKTTTGEIVDLNYYWKVIDY